MNNNKKASSILSAGVIFFVIYLLFGISLSDGFNIIQITTAIIFFVVLGIFLKKRNLINNASNDQKTNQVDDIFAKKEEQVFKSKQPTKKYDSKDLSVKHDYSHRCHKCNTLISSKDKVCPECGAWQSNDIKCPSCGHINPAGNVLCENCNDYLY